MVIGTAGATTQVPFLPKPKWVEYQSREFGITEFDALNATHMHIQWIRDEDGTVGDEFTLTRGTGTGAGAAAPAQRPAQGRPPAPAVGTATTATLRHAL